MKTIVREFFLHLENREFKKASKLLTEDFTFKKSLSEQIDKDEFIDMQKAISKGLSDLKYNANNFEDENGKLKIILQVTAKHTGTVKLEAFDIGPVKATHEQLIIEPEIYELALLEGKIRKIIALHADNGIINHFKQLWEEKKLMIA